MRIRRKPWARPELAACPFHIDDPTEHCGQWASVFPKNQPLHLELGCGKGVFTAEQALTHSEYNLIAIDIKSDILGVAKRNIEEVFAGKEVDNLRILAYDIERILEIMNEKDQFDRIFINFCNPWPKKKHKKKRLTYPRQLEHYKTFLKPDGEIWFKTDDDELFEESLDYFKECGFQFTYLTRDLHNSDFTENIVTEHEKMFSEQGIPIKFLIAKLDPTVPLRVYVDAEELLSKENEMMGAALSKVFEKKEGQRPLYLALAGRMVLQQEKDPIDQLIEERSGLHFCDCNTSLEQFPFYPVPLMYILMYDDKGNYFGRHTDDGPIICVNLSSRCCKVADNIGSFLELILFHPQWKDLLNQAQRSGRFLDEVETEEVPQLEPWQEILANVLQLSFDADAMKKLRSNLLQASGFVIYPNLDRAKKDNRFLKTE